VSSSIRRRTIPRLAAAAAAIALIGPGLVAVMSGPAAAADQDPAAQLVQRAANQVIEVARTSTGAARESGMMRVLQADFDLNYMGRSTLDTHWNRATPEERQRFLNVIASAEAHSYAQRFGQYAGQTVTVSSVTRRGNGVSLVASKLNQSNGEPVAIQWEVRNDGQRPRIVDVKVEGVSMTLTRRSEYNSYIRNHGGQVEPLIAELEARARR
jgi:phospholipid transport system substrate-binding protein